MVWRSNRSLRKTSLPRSSPELKAIVDKFELLLAEQIRTSKFCAPSDLVQINLTFLSIVLITESIFPLNTCFARLRV